MRIRVNDEVRIVDNTGDYAEFGSMTGTVERIYSEFNPAIAIVKFEDELIAREFTLKVLVDCLVKVTPEIDVPEGAKMISRADFDAAIAEITNPEKLTAEGSNVMSSLARILTARPMGDQIKEKIFNDRDVVVMTEEAFILALWDACNPVATSEMTGKKQRVRDCVKVAITALITLEEIVGILFDGSDD